MTHMIGAVSNGAGLQQALDALVAGAALGEPVYIWVQQTDMDL